MNKATAKVINYFDTLNVSVIKNLIRNSLVIFLFPHLNGIESLDKFFSENPANCYIIHVIEGWIEMTNIIYNLNKIIYVDDI